MPLNCTGSQHLRKSARLPMFLVLAALQVTSFLESFAVMWLHKSNALNPRALVCIEYVSHMATLEC